MKFLKSALIFVILLSVLLCSSCDILSNDIKICEELAKQTLTSLFSFNYTEHFSLFQTEIINAMIIDEYFTPYGFTYDQALAKIDETAKDCMAFNDVKFEIEVESVSFSPALKEDFLEYNKSVFEELNLDISKVSSIALCTFKSFRAIYNDTFYLTNLDYVKSIRLYKYDGRWYVDRRYLDDDLPIDLLESDKDTNPGVAYKTKSASGVIQSIEYGYINLGDELYFLTENASDFLPGDRVTITYYYFSAIFKKLSDNSTALLHCVTSINKTDK